MPPRRKNKKFKQLTEFERGRIIGLREGGFSYRAIAARMQRNSSTVMRVWKQWTDEHRTTRKTGTGRRKVTSERDDRHLIRMAVNDRTASSRQLAAHWSTATGVQLSASSIRRRLLRRGLRARVPLYRIPLTANHRRLRLQWALEHRAWRADWHQVVFSDESRFNLWSHDGRVRVRRYAGQRCLPECIIERHSGRTPGVMVWGAISYHGRSNLLRIEGNLNSNRYVREVLQPEVVPFLQGIPGAIFQQDNARPHVGRLFETSVQHNTCNFFLGLLIRRICRLLSTCGIWLVGVSLVIRVLQFQKTNFGCAYKRYGILFLKHIFKICLTPCHVV